MARLTILQTSHSSLSFHPRAIREPSVVSGIENPPPPPRVPVSCVAATARVGVDLHSSSGHQRRFWRLHHIHPLHNLVGAFQRERVSTFRSHAASHREPWRKTKQGRGLPTSTASPRRSLPKGAFPAQPIKQIPPLCLFPLPFPCPQKKPRTACNPTRPRKQSSRSDAIIAVVTRSLRLARGTRRRQPWPCLGNRLSCRPSSARHAGEMWKFP